MSRRLVVPEAGTVELKGSLRDFDEQAQTETEKKRKKKEKQITKRSSLIFRLARVTVAYRPIMYGGKAEGVLAIMGPWVLYMPLHGLAGGFGTVGEPYMLPAPAPRPEDAA